MDLKDFINLNEQHAGEREVKASINSLALQCLFELLVRNPHNMLLKLLMERLDLVPLIYNPSKQLRKHSSYCVVANSVDLSRGQEGPTSRVKLLLIARP